MADVRKLAHEVWPYVVAYAAMLLLVLSYFTGHGAFIYEAF